MTEEKGGINFCLIIPCNFWQENVSVVSGGTPTFDIIISDPKVSFKIKLGP